MVTAVSKAINPKTTTEGGDRAAPPPPHNPTRPPLLPSEPDNALSPRRPKPPQATSRYMSSSSSSATSSSILRRRLSPLQSTTMNSATMVTPTPSLTKRSLSVERSRPANSRPKSSYVGVGNGGGNGTPAAQKMLFTSTRSLSVSFQGESFSIQVSKERPAPSPNLRKITPERRKATTPARGRSGNSGQTENSRPTDQQRWPGRMPHTNCMNRSVDCTDDVKILGGSRDVVKSLQKNLMADIQVSSEMGNGKVNKTAEVVQEGNKAGGSELVLSDSESVSSGGSCGGGEQGQRGPRGIVVPAKFWQEANNRLQQQTDPASPSSRDSGNKGMVTPKHLNSKKSGSDSPITSPRKIANNRGQVSPIRAAVRAASPSKLAMPSISSPLRGLSPSRVRNGVASNLNSRLSNVQPSILSFVVDVRRGKVGENRIVDAHLLRLLYNKLLQWRFVNARADAALSAQRLNAEVWFSNLN